MRYEDTSGVISSSATVQANSDADTLPTGSTGPATGNVITGAGTTTGKAGADTPASAHVIEVRGASGTDTADGGSMNVDGRFGTLAIDQNGNYKYVAEGHAPANFRDIFQYTLADSKGGRATADLIISRGGEIKVAENAQRIVPGPDGVVTLPEGVNLNNIQVVGRDLVVTLPDGSQIVIVDGAVFVPQLVLGGVEVPATNLAALMIESEAVRTVAGPPQSSGGNFDVPVPPLDPGVPLGDLIPPTELVFTPPTFEEVGQVLDRDPEIQIQPDDQQPSVAAVDSVDERGLPTRNGGEPAGSGEIADGNGANNSDTSETTGGTIIINSPDGVASVTINGVLVTGVVGQTIAGAFGTLTITGFSGQNILYSYTLNDNTSGNNTEDNFSVTVTDDDGDQATATLSIDIIDDVPTARPDTDVVAAGTYGPETGNVLTGVGTTSGTAGADTVGADNATITSVSSANVPANSDGSAPFVVNGQYGVLTLQADGSYSYVRNPGTPGGVNDVFNYTLTDGDGDVATTTLTISIGDATPQTGQNPTVLLDDDALPGGNPGGIGDDPDSANVAGNLAGSGGDGPLTFAVQTSGAPAGFTYVSGGAGILLVQQGGVTVLTVTVNANGSYTVVQNAPIDHAPGADENNAVFTINYTVTDQDGDSAAGSFTINVDDDTPEMNRADVSVPTLTVDETNLALNASADYSIIFQGDFGADGPGSISYAVSVVNGTDSGLVDVATGQSILLFNNNGVVEGRVGGEGGAVAFTVSVNTSTGVVTLDQIRALDHPDASNPDDPVSAIADSIKLTASITDGDGDGDSLTVNIGHTLVFEDDGPTISASATQPTLTVDESDLATNASASFASVFSSSFGADGAGTITYALGTSGGASGLVDTATGQPIVLVNNAGVIEGRVGNAAGPIAFTVSIDASGVVTLDQIRAVVHADPNNHDDAATLSGDGLVTITATITDRDGDQASATANIGQNLVFEDDGPSISLSGTEASLTVDETNLAINATTSFAAAFTPVFGADGAGSVSYALTITGGNGVASGLIDVATGQAIVLVNNAGVIEGHVGNAAGPLAFTVSVDGSGNVTLDQIRAVQHPDANNPDDSVTLGADNLVVLTATVTDGDGDSASASLNIGQNLNFEDDGPSIALSTAQEPSLTVDETNLNINASANFASVFTSSFGADGAGTISYALGISAPGVASGLIDVATGQPIVLVNNAGVIEGHVGNAAGAVAFTVSIDANTGIVTLDQIRAVQHPNPANPDDSVTLAADNLVTITATITDRDGDTASATANIGQNLNFEDDGPSISASTTQPTLTVDETNLATNATASFAGVFTAAFGADGPAATNSLTYALAITGGNGVNSGLVDTATGQNVVLVNNGGVIEGRTSGSNLLVFTVSVDSSGNVTLDQIRAVVHPNTADPDDAVTLAADNLITLTATATDRDGDQATATANIGQNLVFEDDGPSASNDVDVIVGGNGPATGNVITGVEIAVPEDANNQDGVADNAGADAPGRVTFIDHSNPAPGAAVPNGGSTVIAGDYGNLTIYSNGDYSYLRNDGTPGGVQDVFTYTFTDADGDSVTATLTISIDDNFPQAGTVNVQLDDDALPGGNPGTPAVGDDPDAVNVTGNLPGSGGDGTLTFSLSTAGAPPGFTYVDGPGESILVQQNGTTVLTITITNTTTGAYTIVQNAPIMHPADNGGPEDNLENNVSFTINYTVTDQDGDPANGTININVDDDTPVVTASGTQPNLTVDETTLATNATASFAGVFTSSYGADGAGTTTYSLGITGGNGVNSGLVDTATGQNVVLVNNGGVIEGRTSGSNLLVFTVSVDGSGNVTLDQIRAVRHPDTTNHDDSVTLAADNLITLTKTVTDADGDTASATANIGQNLNFEDDGPTAAVSSAGFSISHDETPGVQGDANDVAGPLAQFAGVANPGDDPHVAGTVIGYAVGTGAISSTGTNFGADGGTATFSLNVSAAGVDSGLNTTEGTDILLYKEGDLIVGRVGSQAGPAAFALSINPTTGVVSMVQYLSIQHPNTGSADESVSIANGAVLAVVTATDGDGDTSTASTGIGSLISFQDDGPTLGVVQSQQANNDPTQTPAVGTLHFTPGADGAGSTMVITADVTGLKSGGFNLVTQQVGNVLTAYQDTDGDGIKDAGETTAVFTLTVNPSAGTSGQYVFDLITPLDPTVTDTPIGGSSSFGAGPTGFQVLEDVGGQDLSVLTGYNTTGSFNEATWLATGNLTSAMITAAGINGSTAGWGVDNNIFSGTNEFMFFDFGAQPLSDPDGPGGNDPNSSGASLPNISTATFDFIQYTAADEIAYVVHYTDGTFDSGFVPSVNMDPGGPNWTFTADAGKFIADIQLYTSGTAPGKVDLVSVGVQTSTLNETIDFTVQLTDGDGDPTSTGSFSVQVSTGLTPNPPAAQAGLNTKTSSTTMDTLQPATNSNNILMGAFAAAGLAASESLAAAPVHTELSSSVSSLATVAYHTQTLAPIALDAAGGGNGLDGVSTLNFARPMAAGEAATLHSGAEQFAAHSLAGIHGEAAQAPAAAFLQGTQLAAHDAGVVPAMAPVVAMPAAAQLAAMGNGNVAGAQHNQVVSQVLADALHGGGGVPALETALASLAGHGGGNDALAVLASHNATGVPISDSSAFGGFTAAHSAFTMEAAMVHVDAVQPHA